MLVLLVGGAVLAGVFLAGRAGLALRGWVNSPGRTTVTQAVVVERMRAVARLVTSETALRKVVVLEVPAADILGVEVTGLRIYDERSGLRNPFRPPTGTIFRLARDQLVKTPGERKFGRMPRRAPRVCWRRW